jgi:leader peptidase (prepilin peptidase) / N-methyltransferase
MTWTFAGSGALFGLVIGSFLNVVVYRTPRHLSVVRPGSFCPGCKTEIATRDNVPVVSWLWLHGRCRGCGIPIPIRYPLVEAGTAAVFAGLAATIRPLWGVPGWWVLAASIGIAAVIEADGRSCPLSVSAAGTGLGLASLCTGAGIAHHLGPLLPTAVGLGAGALAAGGLALSPGLRNSLGTGGMFAMPAWGACLGWLGPSPALIGSSTALVVLIGARQMASGPSGRWSQGLLASCAAVGLVAAVLTAAIGS